MFGDGNDNHAAVAGRTQGPRGRDSNRWEHARTPKKQKNGLPYYAWRLGHGTCTWSVIGVFIMFEKTEGGDLWLARRNMAWQGDQVVLESNTSRTSDE